MMYYHIPIIAGGTNLACRLIIQQACSHIFDSPPTARELTVKLCSTKGIIWMQGKKFVLLSNATISYFYFWCWYHQFVCHQLAYRAIALVFHVESQVSMHIFLRLLFLMGILVGHLNNVRVGDSMCHKMCWHGGKKSNIALPRNYAQKVVNYSCHKRCHQLDWWGLDLCMNEQHEIGCVHFSLW